jgi:UDP-N-acetylglucosamine acyltransferase
VITVHPTAIVDKEARLGENVSIGPFSVVERDVELGEGTQVHSHVLIADGARIGRNCQIHHGAVVATLPQDLKFSGEKTTMEIGDNSTIREFCTLNRGTNYRKKTSLGEHCFLMAYSHTGHDCLIGNHVIMANGVQLGGHVVIEDWVILGGLSAVHQFCKVGAHALIGGGFRAVQDVPPFILAAGEPLQYKGINAIGLKRRGFTPESMQSLRRCYRLLYRSKLNMSQAVKQIRSELEMTEEIQTVLDFIEKSERGLIR